MSSTSGRVTQKFWPAESLDRELNYQIPVSPQLRVGLRSWREREEWSIRHRYLSCTQLRPTPILGIISRYVQKCSSYKLHMVLTLFPGTVYLSLCACAPLLQPFSPKFRAEVVLSTTLWVLVCFVASFFLGDGCHATLQKRRRPGTC